jgi:hypothetical protein
VTRAEGAIRRHLARPRLIVGRPPLTPQAPVSRLRAMAEAGTPPTPEQLAALVEALQPRRRGRPPGRRGAHDPELAAMAGLRALAGSPLPLYGAPYGPGYSRCHAVAEALRRCGFRQCASPAAVANVARQWRRQLRSPGFRKMAAVMAQLAAVTEEMRPLADALAQLAARPEVTRPLADALSVSSALARVGAHPTLPRLATADFDRIINALGLFKKSGN